MGSVGVTRHVDHVIAWCAREMEGSAHPVVHIA